MFISKIHRQNLKKNTQTEPQKLKKNQRNEYFIESVDKIKKIILEIKFYFFSTFRKITVGGRVCKSTNKKNLAYHLFMVWIQKNADTDQLASPEAG